MKKRVICLLLTLALCVGIIPAAAAVRDTSAEELLAKDLKSLGLFRGVSDTDFDLNRAPSRAEALVMLIRVLGKESEATGSAWQHPFSDVPQWADSYVGYAYQNGLTNGVSATEFGTADATATMYLTFVLRALGYSDQNVADFTWDAPFVLAEEVGILPSTVDTENFWRADVVTVSYEALSTNLKDSEQTLAQKLIAAGAFSQAQYDAIRDPAAAATESAFEVHFIDVGQGDSSLVICDGHAMLIDGGTPKNSSKIFNYLQNLEISYLDYIVCTHPDEDHTGGLSAALVYADAGTALAPVTSSDSKAFSDFLKYLDKRGRAVTVPSAGDSFALGSASVTVLGPVRQTSDDNNMSIVLRVAYGDTSFLFTGDAELEEEHDILDSGRTIRSTVLKVSHHGSSDATSYEFLYRAASEYAVISVGANSYGHPTETVLSRLRDAGVETYRTDLHGTVICRSDGKTVTFAAQKTAEEDAVFTAGSASPEHGGTVPRELGDADYVLNVSTNVFHRLDCASVRLMSDRNKVEFHGTREEVLAMGFAPCKNCHP